MHHSIILLPALLALCQAIPASLDQEPQNSFCAGDKSVAGFCTALTYTDKTDSASPTTSNCEDTCRGILSDAGDWGVDFAGRPAGWRDNMYIGACEFSVSREKDGDASAFAFSMKNQDILDLVDESIDRFAGKHGNKVKAEGTMNCQGHVVRWYVG
ncbi:putative necrosis-inducing factor-domain-containing protein [Hypoxylon fragiforme]|uniref:putative necrosis-inducing factor-domain-containing protein n=1 Tax=Hypoxylon fragiforme TaxID=63214 RepID=UPI0020C64C1E|nr:putative necrosis-inducing factor-domain-containing protein [Hypoxylon fragiforme]KAI2605361.1 putative necrosis-inducing factor-domain-containing protein [Hypoxylon fragiforme]